MSAKRQCLGIIGSSGGSALAAADKCLREAGIEIDWEIVTDRECPMEIWAKLQGHRTHRLEYVDVDNFSENALRIFTQKNCRHALLFYTRRIGYPLISELEVCNIHPALLPAFVGLSAVVQAQNKQVKIFGATLHRVDASLDTGPILTQVAGLWPKNNSITLAQHLSFYQKVWLTLIWVEHCIIGSTEADSKTANFPGGYLSSSGLRNEQLLHAFCIWIEKEERSWSPT